jgi:formyltetrahydrofolate synthetase
MVTSLSRTFIFVPQNARGPKSITSHSNPFMFLGGAAGGGYSQVIPMEEVCKH